jgi:hypothetical protein
MGFGRQMHYRIGLVLTEYTIQCLAVTDVDVLESISRILIDRLQGLQVARISELVDVDDRVSGAGNNVTNDRRADKASAACY